MSDVLIRAALELRLAAMSGALPTAPANGTYRPTPDVPYQRLAFLPNDPRDAVMGRKMTEFRGFLQVTLCFPKGSGEGAAQAAAGAIRAWFKPPLSLHQGGVHVRINDTARIAGGFPAEDRWMVPVSVPWQAWIGG